MQSSEYDFKADVLEPPFAQGVTVRKYPKMLIDPHILRSPAAVRRGRDILGTVLRLQLSAWHQDPAGSLPSDDVELARVLGISPKTLAADRRLGACAGWEKATDGRLYHPEITATVRQALQSLADGSARTEGARRERARRRAKHPGIEQDTLGEIDDARVEEGSSVDHSRIMARSSPDKSSQRIEIARNTFSVTEDKGKKIKGIEEAKPCILVPVLARATADQSKLPKLNAPPHLWACLTSEFGHDEAGVSRPVIRGFFLDVICRSVCQAAGITSPQWRGDWDTVARWLHDGLLPNVILDAIEDRVERGKYSPPAVLRYFDAVVREWAAKHPGQGRERPLAA